MKITDNSTNNSDSNKTVRDRLLDAAEQSFAEKGFDGTNVRDLTAKANCNIAAVNYHFGGKENLYLEVFRRRMVMMRNLPLSQYRKGNVANRPRTYVRRADSRVRDRLYRADY